MPAARRRSISRGGSPNSRGAKIYIKREDLLHTGAHKINNCLGQALLARRMGKRRIIAETGRGPARRRHRHRLRTIRSRLHRLHGRRRHAPAAPQCLPHASARGQRGAASPTAAGRSKTPSARPCAIGSRTLRTTHYLLGSALGPHPYPTMVRDFHRVIGVEARRQILEGGRALAGCRDRLRWRRQQCHRNFPSVLEDEGVKLIGVEAGGRGESWESTRRDSPADSPAFCTARAVIILQDDDGQISADALGFGGTRLRLGRTGARLAA